MKKLLAILISLLLICSCTAEEPENERTPEAEFSEEGGFLETPVITFSVKNATAAGADVVFSYDGETTGDVFMTGSYYILEKDGMELPYVINGEAAWAADAYTISPGNEITIHTEWQGLYGILEPGRYTITKLVSNYSDPGDLITYYSADFIIE